MLCGERNLTGVLVATRDKDNSDIACEIPASCDGKITQTTFINQVRCGTAGPSPSQAGEPSRIGSRPVHRAILLVFFFNAYH